MKNIIDLSLWNMCDIGFYNNLIINCINTSVHKFAHTILRAIESFIWIHTQIRQITERKMLSSFHIKIHVFIYLEIAIRQRRQGWNENSLSLEAHKGRAFQVRGPVAQKWSTRQHTWRQGAEEKDDAALRSQTNEGTAGSGWSKQGLEIVVIDH